MMPEYYVWCPDDWAEETPDDMPEGLRSIGAFDASSAAVEWGELDESHSDYRCLDDGVTVKVLCPDGSTRTFAVSGEASVDYYASEVEEPGGQQ